MELGHEPLYMQLAGVTNIICPRVLLTTPRHTKEVPLGYLKPIPSPPPPQQAFRKHSFEELSR